MSTRRHCDLSCSEHTARSCPDHVVVNRPVLTDAAHLLALVEDWLLHADDAAAEFADFIHPAAARRAAAVLVEDIGQLAACLHRAGTTNSTTTSRNTTDSEGQPR